MSRPDYARIFALELRECALELALEELLETYCELVNCGDCGSWDPETDSEVISAREVLNVIK